MKIVNNSENKPYLSQRDNELSPNSSCNVTAMINALISAGYPCFPKGNFKQDEDNLLDFIRSCPDVQRRWDEIDPKHNNPPNQIHETLCLGTNKWLAPMKQQPIILKWNLRLNDVVSIIDQGGAVVMSGRFRDSSGEIGHIVAVVGYKAADNGDVTHLILDDPWGDYTDFYKTKSGDNVFMPVSDWLSMIREQNNPVKFGHVVSKYEENKNV